MNLILQIILIKWSVLKHKLQGLSSLCCHLHDVSHSRVSRGQFVSCASCCGTENVSRRRLDALQLKKHWRLLITLLPSSDSSSILLRTSLNAVRWLSFSLSFGGVTVLCTRCSTASVATVSSDNPSLVPALARCYRFATVTETWINTRPHFIFVLRNCFCLIFNTT